MENKSLRPYIKDLLIQDRLIEAVAIYAKDIDEEQFPAWFQKGALFLAKSNTIEARLKTEREDSSEIRQSHNELAFEVLESLPLIPENFPLHEEVVKSIAAQQAEKEAAEKKQKKGVKDSRFQWQVFILLAVVKLFILGYVLTLYEVGGLSKKQMIATMSILIPIVATYLAMMFQFKFKTGRLAQKPKETFTPRSLQWMSFALFAVYGIIYFMVLREKGRNAMEYEELVNYINWIEVVLGAMIGYLIATIFNYTGSAKRF